MAIIDGQAGVTAYGAFAGGTGFPTAAGQLLLCVLFASSAAAEGDLTLSSTPSLTWTTLVDRAYTGDGLEGRMIAAWALTTDSSPVTISTPLVSTHIAAVGLLTLDAGTGVSSYDVEDGDVAAFDGVFPDEMNHSATTGPYDVLLELTWGQSDNAAENLTVTADTWTGSTPDVSRRTNGANRAIADLRWDAGVSFAARQYTLDHPTHSGSYVRFGGTRFGFTLATATPTVGFSYEVTSRRVDARELPYSVDTGMWNRELR